ncbi:MAG: thermonuclease family protein [Candidatus Omnitrophica bacterium]|nr:thermonuclease family protein [Candidatus Omnitrophota bacterium]
MKRRSPQIKALHPLFVVFFAVAIISAVAHYSGQPKSVSPAPKAALSQLSGQTVRSRVVRIYDGDTIKLANGEKVRFIGIDAPELHDNPKLYRDARRLGLDVDTIKSMGEEAYEFSKNLLADKDVTLEFDVQPRDKYGRLLAYVYLDDGTFVNEEIVKNGYAYLMTIPPNVKRAADFKALFEQARARKLGLWRK